MGDAEKPQEGVNVQVLLRCRPVSDREIIDRVPQVISCNEAAREVTLIQNAGGKQHSRTFRFDKVFGPDSAQEKLFKQAIVPIVIEVMDGFNCTIFAYGQTGTGKTYTMEGGPRDSNDGRKLSAEAGVIPRSIKQIFDTIEAGNMDSTVKVSFLELYNEELTDLLSFEDDKDGSKKLRLLEDRSGVVVHGLEEVIVRSAAEIYQVLDRGSAKRRTAATLLNNRSSRSHSVFTITIHLKETTPDGEDIIKIGKLNLVDLAGSENISRSGAKDSRAREAGSINQSLLTLGRVITTLVEHSGHIPYRDSKLTRLLRDSLGGRTKTCIIATIAPTVQCQEETISTLDYAHRAKNIRNRPELNQKISKTTMIKDLAAEIERLKVDLMCTREKNGVYLTTERYEQGEMERIQLKDAVKALKAEMEAEEVAYAQQVERARAAHEQQLEALQADFEHVSQQLAAMQEQLHEAHIATQERQFMVLSHQRAEHALAGHAQRLTSELSACSRDLAVMFAKLGEIAELSNADRSVLHELRGYVQTRMEQMGSFVADAASTQDKYLMAVQADATAFKARKGEDLKQLVDQTTAGEACLAAIHSAAAEAVSELSDLHGASAQASLARCQDYAVRASAGLQASQSQSSAALLALAAGLEQRASQLEELCSRQATSGGTAQSVVQLISAKAQGRLNDTAGSLTELQQSLREQHADIDRAVQDVATSLQASLQQQHQVLLSQISGMLQAFAAERAEEAKSALEGVRHRLADGARDTASKASSIGTSLAESVGHLQETEAGMLSCMRSAEAELQRESVAVGQALRQLGVQGAAAAPAMQQMLAEQAEQLQSYCKDVNSQLEGGLTACSATRQSAYGRVGSLASQATDAWQALRAAAGRLNEQDVEVAEGLLKAAEEARQQLHAFKTACAQGTSETSRCVSHEVGERLACQLQLGDAPQRRSLEVPSMEVVAELMCPPEDVVLLQYRKEKAQIVRRGGDVRYANLLLASDHPVMSPPPGVTVRSAPRSTSAQQENQLRPPVGLFGSFLAEAKQYQVDASPAKPGGGAPFQPSAAQRSKIPGAPTAFGSPNKMRQGLADRTNQMEEA